MGRRKSRVKTTSRVRAEPVDFDEAAQRLDEETSDVKVAIHQMTMAYLYRYLPLIRAFGGRQVNIRIDWTLLETGEFRDNVHNVTMPDPYFGPRPRFIN